MSEQRVVYRSDDGVIRIAQPQGKASDTLADLRAWGMDGIITDDVPYSPWINGHDQVVSIIKIMVGTLEQVIALFPDARPPVVV